MVTAKRHRLQSEPFAVTPAANLKLVQAGRKVSLEYPAATENEDLTHRPLRSVRLGRKAVKAEGRRVVTLPKSATATRATDRWGNRSG